VGRGREAANPAALQERLSGNTGAVLDPVFAFRMRLTLEPRQHTEIALVHSCRILRAIDLVSWFASIRGRMPWRTPRNGLDSRSTSYEYLRIERLRRTALRSCRTLLYPSPMLRPNPARLARNHRRTD